MEQSVNLPATANQGENFFSLATFQDAHKVAGVLAKSKLIPQNFQNNVPDCIIAMEMSQRIGASIFSVMQSLHVIHGRPSWSAQFIIASLNSCGRFSPLRFDMIGEDDARVCYAWAIERGTNERLEGPPVSIQMAVREGWMGKNGSKWQTMPELMLRYRAATFFGRLYAPDILMGMRSDVEVYDEGPGEIAQAGTVADDLNARFAGETIDVETGEVLPAETAPDEQQKPPQGAAKSDPEPKPEPQGPPPAKPEPKPDASGDSVKIKAFVRELNSPKLDTADKVARWRAANHTKMEAVFGGTQADGYLQVVDYAEMRERELRDAEKEDTKANGGSKNADMF